MPFNYYDLLAIAAKSITIYIFIVAAIRVFGKKELAQLSIVDLVFILLISNSVQNAMVGGDNTVYGGMAAALGLFVINFIFKWLLRRYPGFSNLIQGEPIMLIYEGKIIRQNLDKAMISEDELKAAVREHGVEDCSHVDLATLEVDGSISVLSHNFQRKTSRKRKSHKVIAKNN